MDTNSSENCIAVIELPVQQRGLVWERLRPRIYQAYIVEKKSLRDVIDLIKDEEGFEATPKMYATKLKKWGYKKNTSFQEVLEIQRLAAGDAPSIEVDGSHMLNAQAIANYSRRNRLLLQTRGSRTATDLDVAPTARDVLTLPQALLVSQNLFRRIEYYIRHSFGTKTWCFQDNESLIKSESAEELGKESIHSLIAGLELGCEKSSKSDYQAAGLHWRAAFREIDRLVQGSYHDIIPNLIQQLSKLQRKGHPDIAAKMKRYITESSNVRQSHGSVRQTIFTLFRDLELGQLDDLEEKVLELHRDVFQWHLGGICYSTFVAVSNHARRRLEHNPQLCIEESLPNLDYHDFTFGISDRRSMDIVRLRAELFFDRKEYVRAIEEANSLVMRAGLRLDQEWLQHYFSLKGWYIRGSCEFSLEDRDDVAVASLQKFLALLDSFDKLGMSYIFNPEKSRVHQQLEEIASQNQWPEIARHWRAKENERLALLEAMEEFIVESYRE